MINSGKKFEAFFKDSCFHQGISCTRLRDAGYRGGDTDRRFTVRNICDFICYGGGKYEWYFELKARKDRLAFKDLTQESNLLKKQQENPDLVRCHFLIQMTTIDHTHFVSTHYYLLPVSTLEPLKQGLGKKSINSVDLKVYSHLHQHEKNPFVIYVDTYRSGRMRKDRLNLDFIKE
jgi:hypothetical protein